MQHRSILPCTGFVQKFCTVTVIAVAHMASHQKCTKKVQMLSYPVQHIPRSPATAHDQPRLDYL